MTVANFDASKFTLKRFHKKMASYERMIWTESPFQYAGHMALPVLVSVNT